MRKVRPTRGEGGGTNLGRDEEDDDKDDDDDDNDDDKRGFVESEAMALVTRILYCLIASVLLVKLLGRSMSNPISSKILPSA